MSQSIEILKECT